MDIWPGFGGLDFGFVFKQHFLSGLLELDIFWLGHTTAGANFLRAGIPGLTIGAGPFELDIAQ
jgi:hypothetical protein